MNVYLALILVGLIPGLFVLLIPRKKIFFEKLAVKGFGLGVYTALIFVLLRESFEHGGFQVGFLGICIGLFISLAIGYSFKEFHHHHEEGEHHIHSKTSAVKILVSDFFHNIVDGIAIISGFAINTTIGLASLIGVLGHQIIQQSGQQILLTTEGVKPKKAILISFVISLSVFFALFIKDSISLESILMALSAGVILFKILIDIKETKWVKSSLIGFIIGFSILIVSLFLIPHTH